ncbi:MAG: DUF305 domain-containing protein [Pseudomonadota bacterium]
MKKQLIAITGICLAAALAQAPALAQHAGHPAKPAADAHAGMSHGGMDMKTMMKDMNDQMANMPMSGDPDVDFARMMRIHHVGAVDMARAQLRDGKNPQMRKMAQDIIAAQNREIAIFDKFLASKSQPQQKK